jgi:hypothetical protein
MGGTSSCYSTQPYIINLKRLVVPNGLSIHLPGNPWVGGNPFAALNVAIKTYFQYEIHVVDLPHLLQRALIFRGEEMTAKSWIGFIDKN